MAKIPVIVYTLPNCVQCESTKRMMIGLGIEFQVVSLLDVPEKAEEFKEKGLMAAPIVQTDTKTWSGFRFDKIKNLHTYIFSQERK